MKCLDFQKSINDFIFDKIDDPEELEGFVNHVHECQNCRNDLYLYYSVRRGFEDVPSPDESRIFDNSDAEMESIIAFYDDYFYKKKKMKKSGIISAVIFVIMFIVGIIFLYLVHIGLF